MSETDHQHVGSELGVGKKFTVYLLASMDEGIEGKNRDLEE